MCMSKDVTLSKGVKGEETLYVEVKENVEKHQI